MQEILKENAISIVHNVKNQIMKLKQLRVIGLYLSIWGRDCIIPQEQIIN